MSYKFKEHKFYKTKAWRLKREDILIRDNRECQMCKRNGGFGVATTVHHIVHLRDDWSRRLDDSNLESLCGTCHNVVHPEKLKKVKPDIHEERWE